MYVHNYLKNKFSWYRKWHEYKYVNIIHIVVVLIFSAYDIYLALLLRTLISST